MNVNDLKKSYARLPGKLIKSVKETPYQGEPKDYVLDFGQHTGTALKDAPVSYLLWIVENVSNRPVCVSIVKKYLNLTQEEKKPARMMSKEESYVGARSMLARLKGISRTPAQRGSGAEEEPSLFQPYVMPIFAHPMSDTLLNGKKLRDITFREFQKVKDASDPVLEYFISRTVYSYRHFVWKTYRAALSIDVSQLSPGEALQYETTLNAVRRIQSVLDTHPDAWGAFRVLHTTEAYKAFEMVLPALN